ncbi:MAG: hypothetical protein JWO43_115 [Candidatus Adlerbacteria bacterium]|nr:hypothetical protein [Candidatus Adlerbacteria bacterium]
MKKTFLKKLMRTVETVKKSLETLMRTVGERLGFLDPWEGVEKVPLKNYRYSIDDIAGDLSRRMWRMRTRYNARLDCAELYGDGKIVAQVRIILVPGQKAEADITTFGVPQELHKLIMKSLPGMRVRFNYAQKPLTA